MIEGRWRTSDARGPEGQPYQASATFTADDEALLGRWAVVDEGRTRQLTGVAMANEDRLCAARGVVTQDAELAGSVGLVCYRIDTYGHLPARWYHPSLGGRIGDGLSAEGPTDGLCGDYRADYASGSGGDFEPLRKTVTRRDEASEDIYEFVWHTDSKVHYIGVGRVFAGRLWAAWGPPGALIQLVNYTLSGDRRVMEGSCLEAGRPGQGIEILTFDHADDGWR